MNLIFFRLRSQFKSVLRMGDTNNGVNLNENKPRLANRPD